MLKIKKVCKTNGMAINTMCRGFSKITRPWKAKISTSVSRSPMVVMPSNFLTKVFSKYSAPFFWVTKYRVSIPPARGITTNSTTDNISVSHGTNTFETPSKENSHILMTVYVVRYVRPALRIHKLLLSCNDAAKVILLSGSPICNTPKNGVCCFTF